MNTMTTILGFDIKGVSNPILMTEILIETPSDRKEMTVPIDMDYMGIDEDTDFDMELSKDFIREVEKFYRDNGRIPTADELKRLVEKNTITAAILPLTATSSDTSSNARLTR